MSQRITELEKAAGVALVRRTTRSVHLTDAGAMLVESTRGAFSEIATSFAGVRDLADAPRGVLRVTAPVAFARQHQLTTLLDNTFASPVNFRPLEHGFDLVVHSATKYLNGHSDIVAGCVVGGGVADGVDDGTVAAGASCARISPAGYASLCTFTYELPPMIA